MVVVLIVALLLTGAGLAVAAAFLFGGLPWALVAGAVAAIAFALALRTGLAPHE